MLLLPSYTSFLFWLWNVDLYYLNLYIYYGYGYVVSDNQAGCMMARIFEGYGTESTLPGKRLTGPVCKKNSGL